MPEFIQSSFAGGEFSPTLWARQELERYPTGLRKARNYVITEHGSARNRAGTHLVANTVADGKGRMIRFVLADSKAFILVFTDQLLRIVYDGGEVLSAPATPYHVDTPYLLADLPRLKVSQSGDVLYVTNRGYEPRTLTHYGDTDWRLEVIPQPVRLRAWNSHSTYALGDIVRASVFSGFGFAAYRALQGANTGHTPSSSAAWWENLSDANATAVRPVIDVIFAGMLKATPEPIIQTAPDATHPSLEWDWCVSAVFSDGTESLPSPVLSPNVLDTDDSRKIVLFPDCPVDIAWNHIPGAVGYRVYRGRNGLFGLVQAAPSSVFLADQPTYCSFTDLSLSPDFASSPRQGAYPFSAKAWQQGGSYRVGDLVAAGGNVYECILAGTSAITGAGPTGDDADVVDGTIVSWEQAHAYTADEVVYVNGNTYLCTSSHTSSATGVGPWGTGWYAIVQDAWIDDGEDNRWVYVGAGGAVHWKFLESEATWNDAYPDVCTFYGGRLYYAREGRIQGSTINDYANFDTSVVSESSQPVDFTLASRQYEEIRSLVGLDTLVALTNSSEWGIRGSGREEAITPTSILARVGSERGTSWVDPVVVGDSILHVQAKGTRMRELVFDDARGKYVGSDLTIYSKHLFAGRTIVDVAYQEDPQSVVWVVLDNGILLSLTYVLEQKIVAWTWHDTQGLVENVCCIPEGQEDAVYLIVSRTVGGATKRFIERMASREVLAAEDGLFLDCALSYDGDPATVFSGLDHLEGMTVVALADGYVVRKGPGNVALVVTDGEVTIPKAASVVHIGLTYTQDIETLDFVGPTPDSRTRLKAVNRIQLELLTTRGAIQVGEDFTSMETWNQRRVGDNFGAIALETASIELRPSVRWQRAGRAAIRNEDPIPIQVLSIIRDAEFGGR